MRKSGKRERVVRRKRRKSGKRERVGEEEER